MLRTQYSWAFRSSYFFIFILCIGFLFSTSACKKGYGCPTEDFVGKVGKDGLPKGKTKSGLLSKEQQKRLNKKKTKK